MKTHPLFFIGALVLSAQAITAQETVVNYQGRLLTSGALANGTYDFRFQLAGDAEGSNYAGSAFLTGAVPVTNGLFAVGLDFGPGIFNGSNYWLQIDVRTNGGTSYTTLVPRQQVLPSPYAIHAATAATATTASNVTGNVSDAQLSANIARLNTSQTFSGTITANNFTGNGATLTNVNATMLNGSSAAAFWNRTGNSNTTVGTDFIGTADNQSLDFKVNSRRALRLEPNNEGAPNIIGGSSLNFVAPGVVGATIAGGGATNYVGSAFTNAIHGNFGVVGGGAQNLIQINADNSTIGGGTRNLIQSNADCAMIGGGRMNTIETNAWYAGIGGGFQNTNQPGAFYAFIGGGSQNTIQMNAQNALIAGGAGNKIQPGASVATIGGGGANVIQSNGVYATVPGGQSNTATNYAFAAGRRAKAYHTGTFVWADATDADFQSTTQNQFLVRASGGVGINTNNPQSALHVNGGVTANEFTGSGSGLTNLSAASLVSGIIPDARLSTNVMLLNSNAVFTGTVAAAAFSGDGRNLTNLDANDLTMGTVSDARLSSNVVLQGNAKSIYFAGKVGIGTPSPAEKLTVAGTVEITSGGIKFPDGTVQTSAGAAPAAPTNSIVSGLPVGSVFTVLVNETPARLDQLLMQRFVDAYGMIGNMIGNLTLERSWSTNRNWRTWAQSNTPVVVTMTLDLPNGGQVAWTISDTIIQTYSVTVADDGLPAHERITIPLLTFGRTQASVISTGKPTLGLNRGFSSAMSATQFVPVLQNVEYTNYVIVSDAAQTLLMDPVERVPTGEYAPHQLILRQNPTAPARLFNWFYISEINSFRLDLKGAVNANVLSMFEPAAREYKLTLASDHLPIEEFVISYTNPPQ